MDSQQVLDALQAQFQHKWVLNAADIGKILGRTEKAIQHLMSRSTLPFQIKLVGKERCVDIVQVANWLCSDASLAEAINVGLAPQQAGTRDADKRTASQVIKVQPSAW